MFIEKIALSGNREVLELLSLQLAAYKVEADLIGFEEIPLLKDGIQSLRNAGETFLGYYKDEPKGRILAGAISYEWKGTVVTICRMMVHPDFFRQGIARALLGHVLTALPKQGATRFVVSTGSANIPAVGLYKSFGFIERNVRTIAPGVTLTVFERPSS